MDIAVYIVETTEVTESMFVGAITTDINTLRHSLEPPDRVIIETRNPGAALSEYTPMTVLEAFHTLSGTAWSVQQLV
jgi:hypothetical protein